MDVIKAYFSAAGYSSLAFVVLLLTGYIACRTVGQWWLGEWTEDPIVNGTRTDGRKSMRLGVFSAFVVGQGIMTVKFDLLYYRARLCQRYYQYSDNILKSYE